MKYIGITSQSPKRRWNDGFGYEKCTLFWKAIVKYGWDNFDHIILFDGLTKKEAILKEIQLIREYRSNSIDHGYNVTKGGLGGNSGKCSAKRVICFDKTNIDNYRIFESAMEASRMIGTQNSTINECCRKKRKACKKYFWMYYDEYISHGFDFNILNYKKKI